MLPPAAGVHMLHARVLTPALPAHSCFWHCCPAVDQRTESTSRVGMRVAVNAMAQDPVNQQYIATGGGDALGAC
jgi:hypothetical protein